MSLPKIQHPTFFITIPSSNKKVKFRPFLVKEEKILLMAKESTDTTDIFNAISQIVNNCVIDTELDLDKLSIVDLEYVYLQLYAQSVDSVVHLSFKDKDDEQVYSFEIDLTKIQVKKPEKEADNKIVVGDKKSKIGLLMKYPPASLYNDKEFIKNNDISDLYYNCITSIYEGDEVFDPTSYTKEEFKEFVDNLDIKTKNKMNEYLNSSPKLEHIVEYKDKNGTEKKILFSTLNDFFQFL